MEKQIKAGDKVRSLVDEWDLRKGEVYEVVEVEGNVVTVLDDINDKHDLYDSQCEIVPERVEFQAGDIVTPNDAPACGFTLGKEYTVKAANGGSIDIESDDDGSTDRFRPAVEFDLVRRPSETPAAVFLIAGMTTEYTTQESAEEFLAEFGDNGKEYTITQVVRRVRVNRTANLETI